MDRVTGWYQAHTVFTVRWIALGVSLFFNLNIIKLSKEIANNSQVRSSLVCLAERATNNPETINGFYIKNFEQKENDITEAYKTLLDSAKTEEAKIQLQRKEDGKKIMLQKSIHKNE